MIISTTLCDFCRPEPIRSGLLVFLATFLLNDVSAQLPSSIVPEVLGNPPDLVRQAARTHDTDANSVTRLFCSGGYHDLFRKKVTETHGSKSLLDRTALYSATGDAGIALDRPGWGASARLRTGKMDGSWQEHDNDYDISGKVSLSTIKSAGWVENRFCRLLLGLGYDPGLSFDHKDMNSGSFIDKSKSLLQDRRLSHFVSGTAYYRNSYLVLFETKHPLVEGWTRIENKSNLAAIEIPLASGNRESGFELGVDFGDNKLGFRYTANAISSDSSFSGRSLLPASLAGNGYRRGIFADLPFLPFKPKGECNLYRYSLNMRGYDYTDTSRYMYLDGNDLVFAQGQLSVKTPWNIDAGFFGEYGSLNSNKIGRLDPYVFSSFAIFDPTKYRIDTIWAEFQAAGFFLDRGFRPFSRDSMRTSLSMAYVTFEGSLRTRDIVFISGFIPDLVNPRFFDLSLFEMILLTPGISYTFKGKTISWEIGLKQLIPIELSHRGKSSGNPSPDAIKQTLWGGTTVKTGIEYYLRKNH